MVWGGEVGVVVDTGRRELAFKMESQVQDRPLEGQKPMRAQDNHVKDGMEVQAVLLVLPEIGMVLLSRSINSPRCTIRWTQNGS